MTDGNIHWFGQLGKSKIKESIKGHPTFVSLYSRPMVPGAFASTQVLSEKKNCLLSDAMSRWQYKPHLLFVSNRFSSISASVRKKECYLFIYLLIFAQRFVLSPFWMFRTKSSQVWSSLNAFYCALLRISSLYSAQHRTGRKIK
jgi:hypothetical protein